TFLHLETSALSLEPFEVSGPNHWTVNYVPYVYMERDLYRPGEEVHLAVILRERGSFRGLTLPVVVRVKDPRGRPFTELAGSTDATGMKAFAFQTPPNAPTGRYALEVWVGERLATTGFVFIETFVPERMTVRVTPEKPRFQAGEELAFRVQADYLFGAPAAGETYKGTCKFTEAPFRSPEFPDYTFGYVRSPDQEAPSAQVEVEGRLDEKGSAVVTCRLPDLQRFLNPVRLTLELDVFEAGSGRSTKGRAEATVHRFPVFIGLKPAHRRILPGRPVQVQGVVLNLDGQLIPGKTRLTYEIYMVSRDYVRVYDPQGGFRWQWTARTFPMTEAIPVTAQGGRFQVQFTPTDYWYDYVVQVLDPDSGATARIELAGWGGWGEAERPDSPEVLKIRLDKSEADYGMTVEAQALLPFEGRILWTLETDTVIRSEWQEARGATASWKFQVPTGVPTAYVSAFLFRTGSSYAVTRAFGVQRLLVRPNRHRLGLAVEAPERVRPGADLKVRVRGDRPFQATVAIVDEGILQITRFATPDAYGAVFGPWASVVRTAETLGWVISKVVQATGGGERPVLTSAPTFMRLVSYWSGLVRSDDRGLLEVTFAVPPYQGRLRVMVVAADVERLGSAETSVRVSSDVVVLPTLPRFAHAGDTFRFPVTLTNTAARPETVRLGFEVDGAEFLDQPPRTVELPPQETRTVWVPLRVTRRMGTLEVRIQATWSGDRYTDTFRLTVSPDRPYERRAVYIAVPPGETDLRPYVRDWLPFMQRTRILLSPIQGLLSLTHLKYLIRYPYGCVEQTASSLLPLLRFPSIVERLDPAFAREWNWADRVRSGIGQLVALQTPSGGFAFWPGGAEPVEWASIYTTFVLLTAQQAGYPVPASTLEDALRYIEGHARARPFGYYVLALGRRLQGPDLERISQLLEQKLSFEDRLFLIGALYHGGRTATAEKALQATLRQRPEDGYHLADDFYSPLRALGVQLYILETLYPGAPEHEGLVRTLVERLQKSSDLYNTQELAWALLALGLRIGHVRYESLPEAELRADGRLVRPVATPQGLAWTVENATLLDSLVLRHRGSGHLYVTIETEGFPARPVSPLSESAGLRVER
ncbi:MAG: MG2 domain-containing protein, partial [Acidobacteria bacterium]|nr:MG2 domain-containing protein [Acidobacteriota bacterium]MDW7985084.1 MG2 domain-containing protein [Acidobacteriota bacterium]